LGRRLLEAVEAAGAAVVDRQQLQLVVAAGS
jgi:hypothetical protein